MNRSRDWWAQAKLDLSAARDSHKTKHYEWACFQSQQAVEKAFKALLLYFHIDSWGHSIISLIRKWKDIASPDRIDIDNYTDLYQKCQELDRHYIQPRYPNGFADGYPAEFYNSIISEQCIKYAEHIFEFIEREIEAISSSG